MPASVLQTTVSQIQNQLTWRNCNSNTNQRACLCLTATLLVPALRSSAAAGGKHAVHRGQAHHPKQPARDEAQDGDGVAPVSARHVGHRRQLLVVVEYDACHRPEHGACCSKDGVQQRAEAAQVARAALQDAQNGCGEDGDARHAVCEVAQVGTLVGGPQQAYVADVSIVGGAVPAHIDLVELQGRDNDDGCCYSSLWTPQSLRQGMAEGA
eukprot:GHRQ01004884.1.p1 GENE.GHRQ01004884.1~~GHRQ01004884.1.p1  ORF type:complete len:211 (-),score=34.28 GHRQ01004884.1:675-1307(-)